MYFGAKVQLFLGSRHPREEKAVTFNKLRSMYHEKEILIYFVLSSICSNFAPTKEIYDIHE